MNQNSTIIGPMVRVQVSGGVSGPIYVVARRNVPAATFYQWTRWYAQRIA
jgi:hypothetical protein